MCFIACVNLLLACIARNIAILTAMISIEEILLASAILLLLSIIASKASGRLGVPALVLFLVVGMLAGSEGPGGIHFDNAHVAQSVGVVALVLILFAGGLDTRWESVRVVLGRALALSTIGVLLTAVLVGLFARAVLGFTLVEGLLLGSIVSSTDAAAVFAVLRSKELGLKGEIKPLLEFESGSNDPMAVFLTVGLTNFLINPESSLVSLVPMFVWQMLVGGTLGYLMGRAAVIIVNRLRLGYGGLYPVLVLALVFLAYSGTAFVGGNGFLAVYLTGVVMGNQNFLRKKSVINFYDGMAWLMQITMFLTMGLLVFPSRLIPVVGVGLMVALFLMFVARPVSVFITLLPSKMSARTKTLVAWVGLRGSVPIILATFPLLAGLPNADMIFNIVFFIVLTSVLLQGTSLPLVTRWLGLEEPVPSVPQYPLEFVPTGNLRGELVEVSIPQNALVVGRQIVNAGIPQGALIALIFRGEEFIVPNGDMVLHGGDKLLVLAGKEELASLRSLIERIAS
jgi:potassium/hydrogen antiporter